MSTVLEYTYEDDKTLSDTQALETYTREKSQNPEALVVIDRLNCGVHWRVSTYKSKREKEEYLRDKIKKIFGRVAEGIR